MNDRYRKSQALYEVGRRYLAGGVSSNFRYAGYGESPVPLYYARGKGSRLTDVDGNEYIDYALANGPIILGHAPEPVLEAVAATLERGQLFAGQHEHELELARRLTEIVPCAELVRFASSGSEAVHAALRLARAHTGRTRIVKFEGHYHGWLDNVFVSVNPSPNEAGPRTGPVPVAQTPGQPPSALEEVMVLPWNDLDAFADLMRRRGSEIAAVIMEPIGCNTGAILPRPGYLEGVRKLTAERGTVLVFDEVITGFRVALGGAQALLGVTPDLAVFAKALAAGFPLAALAGRRDIMELVETRSVMHGGTYNANVMCVAAGLATLEVLARDGGEAYRAMNARGERLMTGLRDIARRHGLPLLVQGLGPVFHPAFTEAGAIVDYRSFLATDAGRRGRLCARLQSNGVRVTARGTWFLSTAHSDGDIEQTLAAAERVLAEMAA